jgi:transcriptional regulator with XRE-family HTH domain
MAKIKKRQKALELRIKKKMSYSQIKKILGVSKSTLSYWLRNYPLSKERIRELRDWSEVRIEKFRQTMKVKREKRLKRLYEEEKRIWLPFLKRELYVAGLFLYWGEGVKALKSSVSLNNTDPKVVKFYLYWITKALKIPKRKIKVYVHLYSDMDINKALNFWSKELKIPLSQFNKPYVKSSKKANIDHRGFGHGTCGLIVNDVRLKEKIMMGIEAVADYYSGKI